jgi:hypothetical protein
MNCGLSALTMVVGSPLVLPRHLDSHVEYMLLRHTYWCVLNQGRRVYMHMLPGGIDSHGLTWSAPTPGVYSLLATRRHIPTSKRPYGSTRSIRLVDYQTDVVPLRQLVLSKPLTTCSQETAEEPAVHTRLWHDLMLFCAVYERCG